MSDHPAPRPLAELLPAVNDQPGRRSHISRFLAADTVQVLYREDAWGMTASTGVATGIYGDVERRDPADCAHQITACLTCKPQWEQDHHVVVFTHGPSGYKNSGCRCPVCRRSVSPAAAATDVVVDADGLPVDVSDLTTDRDSLRAFYAGRVRAPDCPHYLAASERRAGLRTCERCPNNRDEEQH